MDTAQAESLARSAMAEHLPTGWRFEWDNAKRRGGSCSYLYRSITLSRALVLMWDEAEVKDTILHEIAHALVGPRVPAHGAEWKRQALALGGSGSRCHSNETAPAPWIGTCPGGHTVKRYRLSKRARQMSCAQCCPRYDSRLRFTWTRAGALNDPEFEMRTCEGMGQV